MSRTVPAVIVGMLMIGVCLAGYLQYEAVTDRNDELENSIEEKDDQNADIVRQAFDFLSEMLQAIVLWHLHHSVKIPDCQMNYWNLQASTTMNRDMLLHQRFEIEDLWHSL